MTISPVSSANAVYGSHTTQNPPPPNKPSGSSSSPTDTIHLSQAAQAQLQSGGDTDHDGDSH